MKRIYFLAPLLILISIHAYAFMGIALGLGSAVGIVVSDSGNIDAATESANLEQSANNNAHQTIESSQLSKSHSSSGIYQLKYGAYAGSLINVYLNTSHQEMIIAMSQNSGNSWKKRIIAGANDKKYESFQDPLVRQTEDGAIHISFTDYYHCDDKQLCQQTKALSLTPQQIWQ